MGNLDYQEAIFPKEKTYQFQIDSIARKHLWEVREDYRHSTSHGVSMCGPVHEHPQYVSSKNITTSMPLQEGMVITNEPGFYKEGQFGIRIENMMRVKADENPAFLKFFPMTYVPYCSALINTNMLGNTHKATLKNYYEFINKEVKFFVQSRSIDY